MSAKAIIGIGLIAVMVGMGVYLMFNYKTAFAQTMKITYYDGCVEIYRNGNMTSPECTQGRLLDYQEQLRVNASQNQPWFNLNVTPTVVVNNVASQ
jgi:hypothetical protein